MRKLLLIAGAILIVVSAGVLSVRHYNNTQNIKTNTTQNEVATAVSSALSQAEASHAVEREAFKVALDDARLNCEKGLAAYNELTSFQKRDLEEPTCPQPIVVVTN
jgi:hypothetical protein